jgi:SnoaL-like domain
MSQENVEAFNRAAEAANRRDIESALEEFDPELEWHPSIQVFLGGEAMVYRGHAGVRELLRDLDEAWAEFHYEFSRDASCSSQSATRFATRVAAARQ